MTTSTLRMGCSVARAASEAVGAPGRPATLYTMSADWKSSTARSDDVCSRVKVRARVAQQSSSHLGWG